jgi:uncharacterized protein YjbI with pentapeptide repeats
MAGPKAARTTRRRIEGLLDHRAKRAGHPTTPLDLAADDIDGADLHGLFFEDVSFSSEVASYGLSTERRTIANVSFAGCTFVNVSFRNCLLQDTTFESANFTHTEFQDSIIRRCDMRFATFRVSSFARSRFETSDLYRTTFEVGNVFEGAELDRTSLHKADLRGTDLRWRNFAGTPLAQEDAIALGLLHKASGVTPDQSVKLLDRRFEDAVGIYRSLAGLWQGTGLYSDSAEAYLKAKRMERRAAWGHFVGKPRIPTAGRLSALRVFVGHWFADLTCGFGERLSHVVASILVIGVVTGGVLAASSGLVDSSTLHAAGLQTCLLYALRNLIGQGSSMLHPASGAFDFLIVFEQLAGIAFVGLFGFVLGNKVRFS